MDPFIGSVVQLLGSPIPTTREFFWVTFVNAGPEFRRSARRCAAAARALAYGFSEVLHRTL